MVSEFVCSKQRFWRFVLLLIILLAFAGCDGDDDDDDDDQTTDDDQTPDQAIGVHPLYEIAEGLVTVPFPSRYFTREDSQSATGWRLHINKQLPAELKSVLLAADRTDLEFAVNELDGFSTLGSILLPFSDALDLRHWSEDTPGVKLKSGQGIVRLFDLTSSSPKPIGCWISFMPGQNVLVVQPEAPLRHGRRYLVVLVGPLDDAAGKPVVRPALFAAVMQGSEDLPDDPLIEDGRKVRELLESGIFPFSAEDVLLGFQFDTTTSGNQLHGIRQTIDESGPYEPSDLSYSNPQTLTGTITSPDFRRDGIIPFDPSGKTPEVRGSNTIPFIVRLPPDQSQALLPVIYLHGLGESRLSAPEMEGLAVFAIDALLHGDRESPPSDAPFPFLDFDNLQKLRDNLRQTAADEMVLAHTIKQIVKEPTSYGLPGGLLATESLGALGGSLGCINGALFSAVDPQIDQLVCQAGGGLFPLFLEGSLYGFLFPAAIRRLPQFEKQIFRNLMQAVLDAADPVAFADGLIRRPPDDRTPRNVLLAAAFGDRSVPNRSTEALAWSAGLGLNFPAADNWYGLPEWSLPLQGNIETEGQTVTGLLHLIEINATPVNCHGALLTSAQILEQARQFFLTSSETGTGLVIDPENLP